MDKKNVIITVVLVIVAVIIAIIAGNATFKLTKKDKKDDNTNVANETSNTSTIVAKYSLDNEVVYDMTMPEDENLVDTNTKTEPNTGTSVVPSSAIYETNPDAGATDKKQEAIELVKKEWGEDSTVSFRCDHVTETGEYMIAVTSLETATVKNYFKVNLENKTVEVEY